MRKHIAALIIAAFAVAIFAAEYAVTVPANTSYIIVPPTSIGSGGAWTSGETNAVGDCRVSNGFKYIAVTAGVASNTAPSHTKGIASDGAVSWLAAVKTSRGLVYVAQEASAQLWYHHGTTASTNGGEYAFSKGQQFSTDSQGAVSVWSDTEVKLNISDR